MFLSNLQDDEEQGTAILRRIEKKWLGSIKIPFSTVYFNSRVSAKRNCQKLRFNIVTIYPSIGILIIMITQSWDHLAFINLHGFQAY